MLNPIKMGSNETPFEPGTTWENKVKVYEARCIEIYETVMKPTILDGEETMPLAVALSDDKISLLFYADEHFVKEAFFSFVGTYCKQFNVEKLYFITEAWYVKIDKDDLDLNTLSSQSPNREEGLLQLYIDVKTHHVDQKMEKIIRGETISFEDKAELDSVDGKPDDHIKGAMFDAIFNSRDIIKPIEEDDDATIN